VVAPKRGAPGLAGHWHACSCFVKVAANWTATLFFIMSELWGSVVISLLFWSLADDVCNVSEAKVRACAPHPSRRLPCTGL